jgi:hypothetical protein
MLFLLLLVSGAYVTPVRAIPPLHGPVYLLGNLSDADTIALTTALCTADPSSVVLIESGQSRPSLNAFLREWQPRHITKVAAASDVWPKLFPKAMKVVVCPLKPRGQLLQAACLAGILQAPLVISDDKNPGSLRQQLAAWETEEVYAIGDVASFWKSMGMHTYRLKDEAAVQASYLRHALKKGPVQALVVANPFDQAGKGGMSTLAPWITLHKRGVLLLTNAEGDNVKAVAQDVLKVPAIKAVDALVLVGNPAAIPMEKRANPLSGKDHFIETEPLTSPGTEPVSFATGRIFHDDPAIVALMLARPYLWQLHPERSRQALVVSNPGGGLPLLETFSRNTALELRNRGFNVTAYMDADANRADVRAALPKQTLFLWEGHHSTLITNYEVHHWSEPLWPSLIFLQSCLALEGPKALPFLGRGAVGVLGTSSRTFSGSGGALSLSYFDALVYEKQSAGGSLRHAKNFLLCFALLKEKRLGTATKLTGANLRSALAFTLWGDPTLQVPLPPLPEDAKAPITHELHGRTLTIALSHDKLAKVMAANYQTQIQPDARVAGLLAKADVGKVHPLIPLIFREIHFARAPSDKTPRLHGRLPASNWVFTYDARRAVGYLLIRPRAQDTEEIRFTVEWESEELGVTSVNSPFATLRNEES